MVLALTTSLFWAWSGGWRNLLALLGVSMWVWFVTHRLHLAERRSQARRVWQRVGVLGVVSVLMTFKVLPEVVGWASEKQGFTSPFEQWWQPIGVAIIALQAIMYIVDVGRGDAEPASYDETLLVCGFFPKALAGPLVRPVSFLTQLRQPWSGEVPLAAVATLVASATFKRYVLIETMTRFDALTTTANRDLGAWDSLWHLFVGPIVMVVDISAYTELALAAALVCGITLPRNFNAPFSGWTVGEVWRRWHITISGFFRDYVIAPLHGTRGGAARTTAAVMIGLAALGLWHVAVPGMLLWSLFQGTPLAVEAVRSQRRAKAGDLRRRSQPRPFRRWLQAVAVFVYISIPAQLFHGAGVGDAWRSVQSIANPLWATHWANWWVVSCILVGWAVGAGLFSRLGGLCERALLRLPAWATGAVLAVVVTASAAFYDGGIPRFFYQRLG